MLFSVIGDLEKSAVCRREKLAVSDGSIALTFGDLRALVVARAKILSALGVKPGDRIGICMSKSTDQVVAILAVLYANGVFVPILPTLKRDSIDHIATDSGMRFVITDQRRLHEVAHLGAELTVVLGSGDSNSRFPSLIADSVSSENEEAIASQFSRLGIDIAAIIYSSGSTGRPKGIMVTHRNLVDGSRIVAQYLGTVESDRIASILSFNFDYGLNQIWQSLFTGASIHLHELVIPNECIRFLSEQGITALPVMPAIMTKLFDPKLINKSHAFDLSSIRYVCSSGGRVSSDMIDSVRKTFPKAEFFSMYGLTEAFRSTYLEPKEVARKPQSIGKPIPDVQILILDDNGDECAPGVVGELVHRGGCVTRGYWNDPKRTAERFRVHPRYPGEVLVYSGDLAFTDSEGFIFFVGRKDAMLKHNGIRISPTEVEEVVERHPEVLSAVVFGIENIAVGHDVVAVYTTRTGACLDEKTLKTFLRANLAPHMLPTHLVHQATFPTTGNQGKIDRVFVQQQAMVSLGISSC